MKYIIVNPKAAREAGWDKESLLLAICQLCTAKERSRISYRDSDGTCHTIEKDSPESPSLYQHRHLRLFPETFCMSRKSVNRRINNVIGRDPWTKAMKRFGKGKSVFYHFGDVMWLSDKSSDIDHPDYYAIECGVLDNVLNYLATLNEVLDNIECEGK